MAANNLRRSLLYKNRAACADVFRYGLYPSFLGNEWSVFSYKRYIQGLIKAVAGKERSCSLTDRIFKLARMMK